MIQNLRRHAKCLLNQFSSLVRQRAEELVSKFDLLAEMTHVSDVQALAASEPERSDQLDEINAKLEAFERGNVELV